MHPQNFLPKGLKKIIPGFLVGLLLTGLIACKDNKKDGGKESTAVAVKSFQMNCVILERSQVQAWVDSGWTNPANQSAIMKKILLQFYSDDASNAATNMQLRSFPGKTYTDIYAGGKNTLKIDTTCTALMLSGPASLSNNYISIADLDILNPDGTLKAFDFIRFRPVKKFPPYINFDVEVVQIVAQQETILKSKGTDPCPPICP
ncbi:MAG: hypothetical protein ABUL41_01545 [Chitinophagaceae bacterium]